MPSPAGACRLSTIRSPVERYRCPTTVQARHFGTAATGGGQESHTRRLTARPSEEPHGQAPRSAGSRYRGADRAAGRGASPASTSCSCRSSPECTALHKRRSLSSCCRECSGMVQQRGLAAHLPHPLRAPGLPAFPQRSHVDHTQPSGTSPEIHARTKVAARQSLPRSLTFQLQPHRTCGTRTFAGAFDWYCRQPSHAAYTHTEHTRTMRQRL